MQVISSGRSLWIYTLFVTSVQLWGRFSGSYSSYIHPAPSLEIYKKSRDSVVLICQAPKGYHGVLFKLYRNREQVDSQELQSAAEQVQFTVEVNSGPDEMFCCLYKDREGCYSAFSPYLQVKQQSDAAPTRSIPSFSLPVLSVEPSTGAVKRGDMLSFSCSVSALPQQLQSHFGNNKGTLTFLLLRTTERTGATSVIRQLPGSLVSSPEPQPGVFTVGPVRGGEEGEYTCLYQFTTERQLVNSTVSNVVQVTITDMLPLPTLVLQEQTDVWHLLCTGSPAYPGAVFSLYLEDNEVPVATYHAKMFHHQATFPVPVQDTPVASYKCQYSVLLGERWSHSEPSRPLAVTRGMTPPSSSDVSGVDWPLVMGSFSAVVLFLCIIALIAVVAQRKVKAAAREKKKRQEAQLWTRVHAKDHVVGLG
uniref:leukocyte immunoglobulin-like receptor subfamily A member 6 isoform X2 n=1 Tax=Monopterus albus TaxID=43700 RepID=UPI0009B3FDBC|nr:leukocyte immunoglobulin-like receptor subfamily A member 6 isoform X2 [Monopterus albus]